MEKIRINNDVEFYYNVYRNGVPESFIGASEISVKLVNEAYTEEIPITYSITGNVLTCNVLAENLTKCGVCRLFLSYTKADTFTTDAVPFQLVGLREDTTVEVGEPIIVSGDIGVNKDGASAYEVWESYPGNEGKTIEQYFEWLRENPTKVDTSRTITAGNGLTGGGDLTADRTINLSPADDSLTVTADNVKVNTNNTLTSTSTTQPLSANQGKVLNEKVVQVEADLNDLENEVIHNYVAPNWTFGHIVSDGTVILNGNKDIIWTSLIYLGKGTKFIVDAGYKFQLGLFDKDKFFVSRISWVNTEYILPNDYYVQVELSTDPESVQSDFSIAKHLKLDLKFNNAANKGDQLLQRLEQITNLSDVFDASLYKNKQLIIKSPYRYSAWPMLSYTDRLICLYSIRPNHGGTSNGKVMAKLSKNGFVWSEEIEVIDTLNVVDGVTGKGIDNNNDMIFWNRLGTAGMSSVKFELWKTKDGIEYEKITTVIPDQSKAIVGHIGDIINVPSVGLVAFYNTYGGLRSWGIMVSSDNGVNWVQNEVESNLSASDCPVEISAVYLGDGKILGIGRKDTYPGFNIQIESSDYAETWNRYNTNIGDVNQSTPSLILDITTNIIYNYYVYRRRGTELYSKLRLRQANASDVWNNPTNWGATQELLDLEDQTGLDSGNVNACFYNNMHLVSYYAGKSDNTGIYVYLK